MNRKRTISPVPTARQLQILELVRSRIRETGIPPTMREIASALGLNSPNGVLKHLVALQRKGLIARQPAKPRGISIVESPVTLPLAGKISAGQPLTAIEHQEQIDFRPLFASGRCCYVVEGRGLPGSQIGPGDVVIVDRDRVPRQGQPVVSRHGKLTVQARRGGRIAGAIVGVVRGWK